MSVWPWVYRDMCECGRGCLTDSCAVLGTASVCVAGIMAAMRITKKKLSDNTFLFLGAGEVCE